MGGRTFSKKISGEHCGNEVRAGEMVNVDLSYVQDGRYFCSEKE